MSAIEFFSQTIKQLRENKGWTLRRAAEEMKAAGYSIGFSSLSQYENRQRTPDIEVLEKFSKFYDVPCDFLIGLENKENKK